MAKAKEPKTKELPSLLDLDKKAEKFKPDTGVKAFGILSGASKLKTALRAEGIPPFIINLVWPYLEKMLREYGPVVIDKLIEWVKSRFGV